MQARLPEIEELQKQLTQQQQELAEAGFKAQDERAAFEVGTRGSLVLFRRGRCAEDCGEGGSSAGCRWVHLPDAPSQPCTLVAAILGQPLWALCMASSACKTFPSCCACCAAGA